MSNDEIFAKFNSFRNVTELLDELKKDLEKRTLGRFPVRYILSENLNTWGKLLSSLKNFVDEVIYFSDFCFSNDTYPNMEKALNIAKKLSKDGKKILLLPLGELLRIDPKIEERIYELLDFQTIPGFGRIYVPLYGLTTQISEIWRSYLDKERHIAPYLIEDFEKDAINAWIVKDENYLQVELEGVSVVKGFKEYLKLWELGEVPSKVVIYSKLMQHLVNVPIVGQVNVTLLKSPKEFIHQILRVYTPIEYLETESSYWVQLLEELSSKNKVKSFTDYLRKKFNVIRFSTELIDKWRSLNDFEKWLLFYWIKQELKNTNSYLHHAIKNTRSFLDFEKTVWLSVFQLPEITPEHIRERVDLIKKLNIKTPPIEYSIELEKMDDPLKKLKVLSGITILEKIEIIKCIGSCLKQGGEIVELSEIIKTTFPDFYYYLSFPDLGDPFLNKYFQCYINSKVRNELTEELKDLVRSAAERNIIWKFPSRNSLLEKFKKYPQFWIDGMGVEWIGLVKQLIEDKYQDNIEVLIELARANLPTTTEYNKVPEGVEMHRCLDQIFHKNDYKYPESLIEEIECIKSALEKALLALNEYSGVIITSDHGATRFSGWDDNKIKLPCEAIIERNGRYAITSEELEEGIDYYIEKSEDGNYLISKDHRVFEGGRKVPGELHGGATLEEVLIPVILVRRSKPISLNINIVKSKLPAYNPVLRIVISPPVDRVNLRILSKNILGKKIDDVTWEFNLKQLKLKPGIYSATVEVQSKKEKIEIEIESGMKEEELL